MVRHALREGAEEQVPASAVSLVLAYVLRFRRVLEPGRQARAAPQLLASASSGYVLPLGLASSAWMNSRSC